LRPEIVTLTTDVIPTLTLSTALAAGASNEKNLLDVPTIPATVNTRFLCVPASCKAAGTHFNADCVVHDVVKQETADFSLRLAVAVKSYAAKLMP
jgi:hypothetical protein